MYGCIDIEDDIDIENLNLWGPRESNFSVSVKMPMQRGLMMSYTVYRFLG